MDTFLHLSVHFPLLKKCLGVISNFWGIRPTVYELKSYSRERPLHSIGPGRVPPAPAPRLSNCNPLGTCLRRAGVRETRWGGGEGGEAASIGPEVP